MRPRAGLAALVAAALGAAGCGAEATRGGGEIVGETLTVYSLLPGSGPLAATSRDIVDGEKLALAEAGGKAAAYKVNFSALDLSGDRDRVADVARRAMRDPAIIAAIGDLDDETARVTVPLLDAAGVLHVSPGATYAGFVGRIAGGPPGEPQRWMPSGRQTFAPLGPTDAAQAVALATASRRRLAVEVEAGESARALAEAVVRAAGAHGRRVVDDPTRADTVVYAGSDADNALGVVEALVREAPRALILLPEALLRSDLPGRLPAAAARRVRFLSAAPAPGAEFTAAFRERFGRAPGRYARVGYDGMRAVLAAIDRAGREAGDRDEVIREYFAARPLERAARQPFFRIRVSPRP